MIMAKGQVVRGTPIRSYAATNSEGRAPGTPKGMSGTTPEQYTSDKRGYQSDPRSGTPYHSQAGNGPETRRVVVSGMTKGDIPDGVSTPNNPDSNGNGVIFDDMHRESAQSPREMRTMDSPVPSDAPVFDPRDMATENRAHLGKGRWAGLNTDDLVNSPGVMGRGLDSTSQPNEPVTELTADDTLKGAIKI